MEYPYLDTEKREFHASETIIFTLVPIPIMNLMVIRNTKTGKPMPPETEMVYAGGKTRIEKNPFDPEYLKALNEWELEKKFAFTRYIISFGIKENPPEDVVNSYKEISEDLSATEIKYMWVCSLVDTDVFFGMLVEAILGQNTVTEKGLEEVAETFPSDGKQSAD